MSQQSNPATLREALSELRCVADNLYMNLKGAANFNPEGFNTPALEQIFQRFKMAAAKSVEIETALAASGTEAAPEPDTSDIPEVKDWSNAVVGKFYRPNSAQAAASPEGEGRKAECDVDGCSNDAKHELLLADYCMSVCDAHKAEAYSRTGAFATAASPDEGEGEGRDMPWTPEVEAFRAEMMRRFSNKLSMEEVADFSYWSALRQSAAPSGGADYHRGAKEAFQRVVDEWPTTRNKVQSWANNCAVYEQQHRLAQESNTGAVTETK